MATLPGEIRRAFSADEQAAAELHLTNLVRFLNRVPGTIFRETNWADVYYETKQVPETERKGWSNLGFKDYARAGTGVEWKLLQKTSPAACQGQHLMHPAATRRLDYDPDASAETCKDRVLLQWADHIDEFRTRVAATSPSGQADIRWGVLLWAPHLEQFLYFEEDIVTPDPAAFTARWVDRTHRGQPTRTLAISETETGVLWYSVTLPRTGAKLQPYFDVPRIEDGAHLFQVHDGGLVPLWVSPETFDRVGINDPDEQDAAIRRLLDER